MGPEELRGLLRLRQGSTDVLRNRESSRLEFKEAFNFGNMAKYARTMASFANAKGGYLVFGVTNEPHRLRGVNVQTFTTCDPARVTTFLNDRFSPELVWDDDVVEVHGVTLGFFAVPEATDKPVVAVSNDGAETQDGAIYYRYRAVTRTICFPELRALLDERINRERNAWMQHLATIGRAGPGNVGIIDVIRGKVYGGGPPFLIDEALLRQLKFVREGRFKESEGTATLRLVGDLAPVAGVATETPVHRGIHAEDLITAFLAQRVLDPAQAAAYLREAVFQSTPFLPVHYFERCSQLAEEEVRALLQAAPTEYTSTRQRVLRRLYGGDQVMETGALAPGLQLEAAATAGDLLRELSDKDKRCRRTLLLHALRRNPRLIDPTSELVDVGPLAEAVTHLSRPDLPHASRGGLLDLLLRVFEERFPAASPAEKSIFRKAVCKCDELLAPE